MVGGHYRWLGLLRQKLREICFLPFVKGQDLFFHTGLEFGLGFAQDRHGRELKSFGVDTPTTAHGERDRPLMAVGTA